MPEIIVRKGNKEDLPEVLSMITELAIYEKAPDEVTITLEELEEDGFGHHKLYDLLIAEKDNEILGMALYFPKYSTWKGKSLYLEDLVVREQYRQKGIGKMLFDQLVEEAKSFGARRLDWQVLDWNEPAIKFYKKINADLDGEWINCRFTKEGIEEHI